MVKCLRTFAALTAAVCLLLGAATGGAAATPDYNPPKLTSISIGTSGGTVDANGITLEPGDELTITIGASDDVSGVASVSVRTDGFGSASLHKTADDGANGAIFTGSITALETTPSGTYQITGVDVRDAANYRAVYSKNDLKQFNEHLSFTYVNDRYTPPEGTDGDLPEVTDVRIDGETAIRAGGSVKLEAVATDPTSAIDFVRLTFTDADNSRTLAALLKTPGDNGLVSGTLSVSPYAPSGEYVLSEVLVRDASGSERSYGADWDLRFTVTNDSGNVDVTAPKLEQIQYWETSPAAVSDTLSVEAPAVVHAVVKGVDDVSGLAYVEMRFKNVHNTQYDRSYNAYANADADGLATGKMTINAYEPTGVFELYTLLLRDKAGNQRWYSYDESCGEALPFNTSFSVQNMESFDDAVSIDDTAAALSKLAALPDNGSLAITYNGDETAPASLFEAIRGTNKTITFVGGDGSTWEFNGMDIDNPKAVRLGVTFDTADGTPDIAGIVGKTPSVVLHFADNGSLPGKCKLSVKANYLFNDLGGQDLAVYYHNKSAGRLDQVASGLDISAEGSFSFSMTHNSDYVVTKGLLDHTQGPVDQPGSSGDSSAADTVPPSAPRVVSGKRSSSSGGSSSYTASKGAAKAARQLRRGGVTVPGGNVGRSASAPAGTVTRAALTKWFAANETVIVYVTPGLEVQRGVLELLKENPGYTLILRQQDKGAVTVQISISGKDIAFIPQGEAFDFSMIPNPDVIGRMTAAYYQNDAASLRFMSAVPIPVTVALRADPSVGGAKNLAVYRYDKTVNTIARLADANAFTDTSGYLCCKLTPGGDIIISNGELVSKN